MNRPGLRAGLIEKLIMSVISNNLVITKPFHANGGHNLNSLNYFVLKSFQVGVCTNPPD
jgi:hypothetical protein